MKKILFVAFMAALLPVFAQTRVGEIPNRVYMLYGVSGEFVLSGQTQLIGVDDFDYTDSAVFFNNDFQMFKTIVMPKTNTYRQVSVEYFDFDDYKEHYIPITQTLFNNDEQWEYIVQTRTPNEYYVESYSVVQEDGTVLFTTPIETDSQGDTMITGYSCYILKIYGNYYLAVYYYSSDDMSESVNKTVLYLINHQTQSIERVDAELPFNVFPTLVDRSQEITIELGEGNNATEISVIDANGRVLETIPVQAGQREVKIPASKMGHGLNLLNANDRQRQATKKIIVK